MIGTTGVSPVQKFRIGGEVECLAVYIFMRRNSFAGLALLGVAFLGLSQCPPIIAVLQRSKIRSGMTAQDVILKIDGWWVAEAQREADTGIVMVFDYNQDGTFHGADGKPIDSKQSLARFLASEMPVGKRWNLKFEFSSRLQTRFAVCFDSDGRVTGTSELDFVFLHPRASSLATTTCPTEG